MHWKTNFYPLDQPGNPSLHLMICLAITSFCWFLFLSMSLTLFSPGLTLFRKQSGSLSLPLSVDSVFRCMFCPPSWCLPVCLPALLSLTLFKHFQGLSGIWQVIDTQQTPVGKKGGGEGKRGTQRKGILINPGRDDTCPSRFVKKLRFRKTWLSVPKSQGWWVTHIPILGQVRYTHFLQPFMCHQISLSSQTLLPRIAVWYDNSEPRF